MKTIRTLALALALVALPGAALAGTAKLQIIHNAADPAAASVDIYVNGDLLLDDFAFRAATPFVTVPAGVTLNVGVAPGTSGSADDVLATFPVTLAAGGTYVAVANGVLDPAAFAANPDGRSIGFTIFAADKVYTQTFWGTVLLRAFHGATDAPAVDLRARKGSWSKTLWGGVGYGDVGDTRLVLAGNYLIDVTLPGQPQAVVATFRADLRGLARGSAFVFASGFLDPAANGGGPGFGLFAALPSGQVVALPADLPMARLQVIHNAADPAAAAVDVYVNGDLLLDDFAFRAATPFIDVPAGVTLNVGIAPATSTSADDALAVFPLVLDDRQTYVAMATGVLDPGAFAANPGGASIGFTVVPLAGARERGYWGRVAVTAFHGATDAPAVDIRQALRRGRSLPLVEDLSYGRFSGYTMLKARSYTLQVTPAGQPGTVVASFVADLSGLGGGAAVVFASGFLDPTLNRNGEAFGLFAALPGGQVVALPPAGATIASDLTKDAGVPGVASLGQNYPNPFNPLTTIEFALPRESRVSLKVFDTRGRLVRDLVNEVRPAGVHAVAFDGQGLASGLYFYRIDAGDFSDVGRMTLVK
ncbi:MAG: DUF4397 domain-containing protein [Krumholzibacteria bacterium]|nr:DUF4397 domain-containing protein [Candidatus Krumholzibacteria bacterium]